MLFNPGLAVATYPASWICPTPSTGSATQSSSGVAVVKVSSQDEPSGRRFVGSVVHCPAPLNVWKACVCVLSGEPATNSTL